MPLRAIPQDVWSIVANALAFGAILSAALFGLILLVLKANPEIMLNDYPPDVRRKWGPMSDRAKRQRVPVVLLVLAVIVAIVTWSTRSLAELAEGDVTFQAASVHFLVMFGTFNVLDWLALDWPLVYWQPRFIVLPGTEGMAGYRSYWFHFRGFLIGCLIVSVGSILAAAIVSALA
jgi:hypothetical protein